MHFNPARWRLITGLDDAGPLGRIYRVGAAVLAPAAPTASPVTLRRAPETVPLSKQQLAPRPRLARLRLPLRLTPEWGIALLATTLSIGAYAWYAHQGLTLAYADSIGHMMIARRVFFSRTPGLAQLGTVWLPLTHMLMLPLIWWDALLYSGLGGALPSMVAYVLGAVYLYRLAHLVFGSTTAGVIAALVFLLNPSTLYMQGTPMTELPLMGLAIMALFYVVRWAHDLDAGDLVKAAAATAAGTLVRYDAWAVAGALAAVVAIVAWRRSGRQFAEASTLLYGTFALAGCVAWLIYQQVILGNAFAFFNGPYSAARQQQIYLGRGQLQTLHDPGLSLHVYTQAVLDTVSWPVASIAAIGLLLWTAHARWHVRTLAVYALLIPFVFNWYSLVRGNSILRTPEISFGGAHSYFNVRYGMMMIPAIALFFAYAATRIDFATVATHLRPVMIASLVPVLLFAFSSTVLAMPYTLQDPVIGSAREVALEKQEAVWLAAHCASGQSLISESVFEVTIFYSRIPLSHLITDSSGGPFQQAMQHPERSATCLVMDGHADNFEPVWDGLHARQDWRPYFKLAAQFGSSSFYQRITLEQTTGAALPPAQLAQRLSHTPIPGPRRHA
jgi:hypothetical protein